MLVYDGNDGVVIQRVLWILNDPAPDREAHATVRMAFGATTMGRAALALQLLWISCVCSR